MTKPVCFNRPDYRDQYRVRDGWSQIVVGGERVLIPNLIEIPNPMSKTCMQHTEFGEAHLHHWDCDECKHLADAPKVD